MASISARSRYSMALAGRRNSAAAGVELGVATGVAGLEPAGVVVDGLRLAALVASAG